MGFLGSGGVGQVNGGYLGLTTIVYKSSGVFRGKESSNRIKLSRLVQDLLNFGVLGSLQLWGWGWVYGGGGGWGVLPTHMHMYAHTCTCTHVHIQVKHDNFNCKWQPPLGESLGIPYDVIRMHACVCMHVNMCRGYPLTTSQCNPPNSPPHPSTPHPPGGTPGIS